jgi:hypothetical protein
MSQYSKKTFVWIAWMWMIFMLLPAFQGVQEYTKGLDPSWCIALKVAIEDKFRFGQNFLFTYGPLGFLNTGYIPNGFIYQLVAFVVHLLIQVGFVVLIIEIVKKSVSKEITLFFAGLCFFPYRFVGDLSFSLLILQVGFLLLFLHNKKNYSLGIVSIITIIAFFIKLNLSLAMLVIWFGSLLFFGLMRYLTIKFAFGFAIFTVVLLLSLAHVLQTDLMTYLLSGIKLIDGYIDAQAVMNDITGIRLVLALSTLLIVAFLFLWICWDYLPFKRNNNEIVADRYYVVCLIAMSLFLSYKQSFASLSSTNLYGFFLFFPVMMGLILLVENSKKLRFKIIIIVLCGFLFRNTLHWYWSDKTFDGYIFSVLPTAKKDSENWQFRKSNWEGIKTFINSSSAMSFFVNAFEEKTITYAKEDAIDRSLPIEVIDSLKKGTVDILPWEISYIMVNKLKYNPRPIVQTYQAYSGYLDSLNAHKYESLTAPDYLLYQELPYREQYFFFYEGLTKKAILKNFEYQSFLKVKQEKGTFDTLLIFKKLEKPRKEIIISKKAKPIATFSKLLLPPTQNILFVKWNLKYSWLGQMSKILFQPPYLFGVFEYSDGSSERFRLAPNVMNGGVIANKRVRNNAEAFTFFSTQGSENISITSIKLESPYPQGFEKITTVEFKEIKIQND